MKLDSTTTVILSAAKNPEFHVIKTIKAGFFAALRMTDMEGFCTQDVAA